MFMDAKSDIYFGNTNYLSSSTDSWIFLPSSGFNIVHINATESL